MTENEARKIISKELPDREIESIKKKPNGYFVVAYGKKAGPTDMSGTAFMVNNDGSVDKLSVFDMLMMD